LWLIGGYDTSAVRQLIKNHDAEPVSSPRGIDMPPGSTQTIEDCYDIGTYRKRHVTLRLFGRCKENNRLAMRSLKLDSTFFSFSFISLALMKAYYLFC
jgi:hypothetical protein